MGRGIEFMGGKSMKISIFLTICLCTLVCTLYAAEKKPEVDAELETRLEYARVLGYQKHYKESLEELNKILQKHPKLTVVKVEMVKAYLYQNEYDDALGIINQLPAAEITPRLELLKADIFLGKKEYSKAEALYKKSLEHLPEDKDAINFKLAQMYSWEKRYPESIELYLQLITEHPDDIQLKRQYGRVLSWAGKHAEAASVLKETLD